MNNSQNNDQTPENVKSKKSYKKIIIIVVAVVALIGVCIFAFAGKITNSIMKLAPAEKHLSYVVKTNMNTIAEPLFEAVNNVKNSGIIQETVYPYAAEGTIKAEVSGSLKELIKSYNVDVDNAEIGYIGVTDKDRVSVDMHVSANGEELGNIELRMDFAKQLLTVLVPELGDTALSASLGEAVQMDYTEDLTDIIKNIPDTNDIKKIFSEYIDVVLGEFEVVKREKQMLQIGSISKETVCFEVELTEQTLIDMKKAVLEKAKDDEKLFDLVKEYCDALDDDTNEKLFEGKTSKEVCDDLKNEISDLYEEVKDEESTSDETVVLRIYTDKNSKIVAAKIADTEGDVTLFIGCIEKDGESRFEISIKEPETDVFVISGKTTKTDGKISGDAMLTVDDESFISLAYTDLGINDEKISGTITVSFEEGLAELVGAEFDYDISVCELSLTFNEGTGVTLSLKENKTEIAKLVVEATTLEEIPEMSEHTKTESDPDKWAESFDQMNMLMFVMNIADVLGIPLLG